MKTQCASSCQNETCHCSDELDILSIQTDSETKEEWRGRIIALLESKFRTLNLWLGSSPRNCDLESREPGYNFSMVFNHVLGYRVLVTPHNTRGVDVSITRDRMRSVKGMYDVIDVRKVIKFVETELTPSVVS